MVIRQLYACDSTHIKTELVYEAMHGQTVWHGDVEVFSVSHPKTATCYAWSYRDDDGKEHITAVLGTPPVNTALDAVRISIVAEAKKKRGK